jgi:hypothetical protein
MYLPVKPKKATAFTLFMRSTDSTTFPTDDPTNNHFEYRIRKDGGAYQITTNVATTITDVITDATVKTAAWKLNLTATEMNADVIQVYRVNKNVSDQITSFSNPVFIYTENVDTSSSDLNLTSLLALLSKRLKRSNQKL